MLNCAKLLNHAYDIFYLCSKFSSLQQQTDETISNIGCNGL